MKLLSLIFFLLILNACSNLSANLMDVKICDSTINNICIEHIDKFSTTTKEISLSGIAKNVQEGTEIDIMWKYVDANMEIGSKKLLVSKNESNISTNLLKPKNDWPIGNYEVELKISTENSKIINKRFRIE